jgi:diacylglycerol kinase family enzyme
MNGRRLAAIGALLLWICCLFLAVGVVIEGLLSGLSVVLCTLVAAAAGAYGLVHRGAARVAGFGLAAAALAGSLALILSGGQVVEGVLILAGVILGLEAARRAFAPSVRLPKATPPRQPVLFFNPRSGGGKAERFNLAAESRERGIEPVELRSGGDLEALVREAVERGADGLAVAGGDGTQAIAAGIAAELDLPYACIPAGTRNHFALDLGVDRTDVVGALDAFVDGGERRVDLAEVNGRVFVNNVSLGVYAEGVQREEYRDAKIRTLLDTVPDVLGPEGRPLDLSFSGPDGGIQRSGAAILISNNPYRLGGPLGPGTRPRLDTGRLGIAVFDPPTRPGEGGPGGAGLRQWSAPSFQVDSGGPVPAGVDGEALMMDPPLRFRSVPGALRVRIARSHPGASPSAQLPNGPWEGLRELLRIASGRRHGSY